MAKSVFIDFAKIKIYEDYLVVEINSGVHLTPDHHDVLEHVADTYFKNRPFVYITNRVKSYSVDPVIYSKTSKIPNLLGMAVVANAPVSKANAEVEKLFVNKPFEIFQNLEEAKDWATKQLEAI